MTNTSSVFEKYIESKKPAIQRRIDEIFKTALQDFGKKTFLAKDIIRRMAVFSKGGKMIRGGLVALGAELTGKPAGNAIIDVAAAMEIIHSSLLAHDDVMDNDWQRRKKPSIFAQYHKIIAKNPLASSPDTAKSIAVCCGDFGFFLAIKLIAGLPLQAKVKTKLLERIGLQIAITSLAQADDVFFGAGGIEPTQKQIESLYINKTGCYSISLPLSLGAITSEINDKTIRDLERYGELIGFVFQMRDDYLGVVADSSKNTKQMGSDIRENKKTILRALLYDAVGASRKGMLDKIFGNKNIREEEIGKVKKIIFDLGIVKQIERLQNDRVCQARRIIESLSIETKTKSLLLDLVDFAANRQN